MSRKVIDKIDYFLKKYKPIDDDEFLYEDNGTHSDFLYPEFYMLKYFYDKYNFDLNKLQSTSTYDEYWSILNEELKKIPNFKFKGDLLGLLFEGREEIFDYIKNIDFTTFDITIQGDTAWRYDEYLNKIMDFSKIKDVLSIYNIYYNPFLNSNVKTEVIGHDLVSSEMRSQFIRLELINKIDKYELKYETFPIKREKKYDLVFMNFGYTELDIVDKTSSLTYDERLHDVIFDGNNSRNIITSLLKYLTEDGKAVLYTPLSLVSQIDDYILDRGYIEKIIFLPSKNAFIKGEVQDTVFVYIILSNSNNDEKIEMINLATNETKNVSVKLIKQYHGNININLYIKHNPKTKKLYDLKNDNINQFEIIKRETEFIDKLIDEFDFNNIKE